MKKLLLLACTIAFTVGCSSNDDNSYNNSNNNTNITPPAWIQGTWLMEGSQNFGYKFYSNDICQTQLTLDTCMKEYINLYQGTQIITNVTQQISNTEYKCVVTVSSASNNFHFQKISANVIKDINMSNLYGHDVLLIKR